MDVQADAVDASPGAPLPSFLPPDANAVAQALWRDGTLRSLSAADLARRLHVNSKDATAAIGALIGVMNAMARGNPNAPLTVQPSLAGAIGPFMSMDAAMARYGAHMGPIVSSPSPLHQPYAGPDRQLGAGRASGGRFGMESGPGPEAGAAGTETQALDDATSQLLQFLQQNGCNADFAGICGNFQEAYNNVYSLDNPALTVDDKYGPITQSALAQVMHDTGYSDAAPPACSYAAPSAPRPAPVSPSSPVVAPKVIGPSMLPTSPVFWGLAAAAAAIVVLAKSKHPPQWVRKLGL